MKLIIQYLELRKYFRNGFFCWRGSSHLGGALSIVEIVAVFFYKIKLNENPEWNEKIDLY